MSANWLQVYLDDAVTRIYCTTCGAMKFRRGVLRAMSDQSGLPLQEYFDPDCAMEIAIALAAVAPPEDESSSFEEAVRCLLFDLWSATTAITTPLEGAWAGAVLARMRSHYAALSAARREREEFERAAPRRREEKRLLKQQQHQARLELKKQRDQVWRERQPAKE